MPCRWSIATVWHCWWHRLLGKSQCARSMTKPFGKSWCMACSLRDCRGRLHTLHKYRACCREPSRTRKKALLQSSQLALCGLALTQFKPWPRLEIVHQAGLNCRTLSRLLLVPFWSRPDQGCRRGGCYSEWWRDQLYLSCKLPTYAASPRRRIRSRPKDGRHSSWYVIGWVPLPKGESWRTWAGSCAWGLTLFGSKLPPWRDGDKDALNRSAVFTRFLMFFFFFALVLFS